MIGWTTGLNQKLHTQLENIPFLGYEDVDPLELVTANRFDVLIKIRCIYLLEKGAYEEAYELYLSHIKTINNFFEADGRKRTAQDFWHQFLLLYDSFKSRGFDSALSIIPVGINMSVIDGSHRLALSIYFKLRVKVAKFDYSSQITLDVKKFEIPLGKHQIFASISTYLLFDNSKRVIFIWPRTWGQLSASEMDSYIHSKCSVLAESSIVLTSNGLKNVMISVYRSEPWILGPQNKYSGIKKKYEACKSEKELQKLRIYLVSQDEALSVKTELRDLVKVGNHSAHSSDTIQETLDLVNLFSSEESIDCLNSIDINLVSDNALALIDKFNPVDKVLTAITSSLVLSLFSKRLPEDCDYLSLDFGFVVTDELVSSHSSQLKYYPRSLSSLLLSDKFSFYFLGKKFISPKIVLEMKYKRMELKDAKDLLLFKSKLPFKFLLKATISLVIFRINFLLKSFKPRIDKESRNQFYHLLIYKIFSILPFSFRIFRYAGYWGKTSKNDSLVRRLSKGGIYEKDVTLKILELLPPEAVFVDIGANIGLVTLFTARSSLVKKIYAFEPGPIQFSYLKHNIHSNHLQDLVSVNNLALGSEEVIRDFSIHGPADSSGDGFVDTQRAGETKTIQVGCSTLDSFFSKNEVEKIDLIKIDTEGAEFEILQGAIKVLKKYRPKIIFEWWPANYEKHNLRGTEVYEFFSVNSYQIRTLKDKALTLSEFVQCLGKEEMFIAERLDEN